MNNMQEVILNLMKRGDWYTRSEILQYCQECGLDVKKGTIPRPNKQR